MKQILINNIRIVDSNEYYKIDYERGKIILVGLIPIIYITKSMDLSYKKVNKENVAYHRYILENLVYKTKIKLLKKLKNVSLV